MSLIPLALEGRDLIRSLISAVERVECDLSWTRLEPTSGTVEEYSAEDGGSSLRELRTYKLIAVKAWATKFSGAAPARGFQAGYVGLILPQDFRTNRRVSVYRQVLEAEVARQAAPRNGLALFDGFPPIRWGKVGVRRWRQALEFAGSVVKRHWSLLSGLSEASCESEEPECLAEVMSQARVRPLSAHFLLRLASKGGLEDALSEARRGGLGKYWIDAMENLERLVAFKAALEAVWASGSTPLFVVKTSRTTSLCGSTLPDVHIIERTLWERRDFEPGFTARLYTDLGGYFGLARASSEGLYPPVRTLRDFYEGKVSVLSTFARLRTSGYVFKVEAVLRKDQVEGANEEALARDLLSRLSSLPLTAEGYPVALVIADRNARVTEDEMDGVLRALGADLVPESRSVLRV